MTDPDRDCWHILGAGALGTLFAHRLSDAGVPVTLLYRERGAGTLAHHLASPAGEVSRQLPVRPVADPGRIRQLLVTVKAPAVAAATASLAGRLDPGAPVVILANGLGFEPAVRAALPEQALYRAVTSEGAWRDGPGRTVHAGAGETLLGLPGGATAAPGWFVRGPGRLPRVRWDGDIDRALWQKLAVNCAVNGLTALHRCPNGDLLRRAAARRELDALVAELCAGLRALGRGALAGGLRHVVHRVLMATRANRSSMLTDVLAGRRTEIDYINGYLLATAAARGVPLPRNADLVASIRALQ
jgi:2-dehydropantoate 2-reductase